MHINENGRSMIEMLGVLAIIGVMTVGGLNIIGRSRNSQQIGQLVSEVARVAMTVKKMACEYDTAYGNYTNFLYKSEAYSDELKYEDGKFIGPMDAEITITGTMSYFEVNVADLSEDACIQLAGNDWGRKGTNGFLSVSAGSSAPISGQMGLDVAATNCEDGATVKIKYQACYSEEENND